MAFHRTGFLGHGTNRRIAPEGASDPRADGLGFDLQRRGSGLLVTGSLRQPVTPA